MQHMTAVLVDTEKTKNPDIVLNLFDLKCYDVKTLAETLVKVLRKLTLLNLYKKLALGADYINKPKNGVAPF